MEAVIEETRAFERDLRRLSPEDRRRVTEALEKFAMGGPGSTDSRDLGRVHLSLPRGLTGTLFSLRAGRKLRVIFTAVADPVFDQYLVTALRAVALNSYSRAIKGLAESFFQTGRASEDEADA